MSQSNTLKADIDRLLALTGDYSHVELAAAWGGVTASFIGKLRGKYRPKRMDQHRLDAMRQLIARLEAVEGATAPGQGRQLAAEPASARRVREILDRAASTQPAASFAEHVLVTAGRIIQLAEDIAHAAAQQQQLGRDVSQRAVTEHQRAPVAHHAPAKAPKHEKKHG